jgi:hypothetical protein
MSGGQAISSKSVEVPSFDELMWPMLQALKLMGGSATNEELLAKIIELEAYSPNVQAFQHSDNRQTKLNYNLAWAKTYLKKVGAVENSSRGVWSLTKIGEQLTPQEVLLVPARVRKQVIDDKRAKEVASPGDNPAETSKPMRSKRPRRTGRTSYSVFCKQLSRTPSSGLPNVSYEKRVFPKSRSQVEAETAESTASAYCV